MKNFLFYLLLFSLIPLLTTSQNETEELLYIEWFGDDEIANELVAKGIGHLVNIEREKAYTFFQAAVAQDPSLFAPHVPLAWMSQGDEKAHHIAEAKRLVAGKNEPSRLYVSLLEVPDGEDARSKRRAIWKKIHEVAWDGDFIHFQYALSLDDPKAQIAELEKMMAKPTIPGISKASLHNILGYAYYNLGDKEKAKMHFDTYLEMRPDGYNPYDSMGEYYLMEGDLETALSYYQKAREKYPSAVNANNKIKEIEAKLDERGDLIWVRTESVATGQLEAYLRWGKEFKEIADKTNFRTFGVNSAEGRYSYVQNIGKSMSGLDDLVKEWQEWDKANPELIELYEKYKHTISSIEFNLWRASPEDSYEPEGYDRSSTPITYVRASRWYLQFGSQEAIRELLAEFKAEWQKHNITQPYYVNWNVIGKEQPCVLIRVPYKNREAWLADRKEVSEKIAPERLADLRSRWYKYIRKVEEHESFPQPDLSHVQEPNQ